MIIVIIGKKRNPYLFITSIPSNTSCTCQWINPPLTITVDDDDDDDNGLLPFSLSLITFKLFL